MLALKATQHPKIIYEKLNPELKKDSEVLELGFPKSKYHAHASRLGIIQQARRQNLELNSNLFAPQANFQLVNANLGKKLSPERSAKKLSPERSAKRSAKNLGGGIKKSKKRKTKKT